MILIEQYFSGGPADKKTFRNKYQTKEPPETAFFITFGDLSVENIRDKQDIQAIEYDYHIYALLTTEFRDKYWYAEYTYQGIDNEHPTRPDLSKAKAESDTNSTKPTS